VGDLDEVVKDHGKRIVDVEAKQLVQDQININITDKVDSNKDATESNKKEHKTIIWLFLGAIVAGFLKDLGKGL
jgi:hypothetical protein